jgi:phage pi2 protein 07
MASNIEIKLFVRIDKNGNEYLIGSPDLPAQINLNDYTFIVFYPEEDGDKAKLILRPKRDSTSDET